MKIVQASALALVTAAALHLSAKADQEPLDCSAGPVNKIYGGTAWLVYGCSDGYSLVFTTQQGNPAAPFYFMLHWEQVSYRLVGEGTGNKMASDRAYADIKALSTAEIQALLTETQHAKAGDATP